MVGLLQVPVEKDGTENPPPDGDRRSVRNVLLAIRNVLLWSYDRGTWQYDVLCLLIVATIFLVPGDYFGDRDRELKREEPASTRRTGVSKKSIEKSGTEIMVGSDELKAFVQTENLQMDTANHPAEAILAFVETRCKCKARLILPYEVTRDSEGKLQYRVWYRKQNEL